MTAETIDRTTVPKDVAAYEAIAGLTAALSSPLRIEMVEALAQCPRTVESLSEVCALPIKTVSHHLQKLLTVGLVRRRKEGRHAIYSLSSSKVAAVWSELRHLAEDLSKAPLGHHDVDDADEPAITTDTLLALIAAGRATAIDVRPSEEFESGHLPGARSVPLDTLTKAAAELPKDELIVAVCRGPYCRLADRAVEALRELGYDAIRCTDGVTEWRRAGHPVEPT